jgi:sterol O-acyltransferase
MSSSADIRMNGNGNAGHDHILRPRAVKAANPSVLRTMSEDGYLAAGIHDIPEGTSTGHTRYISPHSIGM